MTQQLPFPVTFRPVEDGDIGFVANSWLRSYHGGSRDMREIPLHRFKREQRAVIRDCLNRGKCIVACEPTDPTQLFGFACGWDDLGVGVLHYVYVKETRRRVGLARALVNELGKACGRTMGVYTHRTTACEFSVDGRSRSFTGKLGLRYDPFSLVRTIYASDGTVRAQSAPSGDGREPAAPVHQGGPAGGTGTGHAA